MRHDRVRCSSCNTLCQLPTRTCDRCHQVACMRAIDRVGPPEPLTKSKPYVHGVLLPASTKKYLADVRPKTWALADMGYVVRGSTSNDGTITIESVEKTEYEPVQKGFGHPVVVGLDPRLKETAYHGSHRLDLTVKATKPVLGWSNVSGFLHTSSPIRIDPSEGSLGEDPEGD